MSTVAQMTSSLMTKESALSGIPGTETGDRFRQSAGEVLLKLCRAIERLIAALPVPIRRAGDLQKELGLDRALAWRLFQISSVADAITAGPLVPRPAPMAKALKAAAEHGASAEAVRTAEEAVTAFERFVKDCAGDRRTFDAMMLGLRQDSSTIPIKDRRAAFRANCSIFGLQAAASYSSMIIHPSDGSSDRFDHLTISGIVDLQRIRADAQLSGTGWTAVDGAIISEAGEPVRLAASSTHDTKLLEAFCSAPLPRTVTAEIAPGVQETAFELNGVGQPSSVSYFVRTLKRSCGIRLTESCWEILSIARVPVAARVMDFFVPEGWSTPSTLGCAVFANLRSPNRVYQRHESDQLPMSENCVHLGEDIERLKTPLIPRCPELIGHILEDAGWNKTRFDIYRCMSEYPILLAGTNVFVDAAVSE